MQWLFILFPGIISTCFTEKLEKRTFSVFSFIKQVCIYDLFINFSSSVIYHYIIRTPESILENFKYNTFLIHYTLLNIVLSIFIPVIYCAIKPHFSIDLEKNTKESEKSINEEQ